MPTHRTTIQLKSHVIYQILPWVLGFQDTTAMTVHVIIGIIVAALAAVELWIMHQNPPRLTAGH
jgi:hypothetical protein